jgi:hypothetical protein
LALALGAAGSGCGALKRVHECEAVIETVNSGLEDIHVQVPDAGTSAPAYEQIAVAYEDLAKRLAALAPEDSSLERAVASYKELAERAAQHSRSFSEELATRTKSAGERKSKDARLKRIHNLAKAELTRETSVIRKLDALCHPQ